MECLFLADFLFLGREGRFCECIHSVVFNLVQGPIDCQRPLFAASWDSGLRISATSDLYMAVKCCSL